MRAGYRALVPIWLLVAPQLVTTVVLADDTPSPKPADGAAAPQPKDAVADPKISAATEAQKLLVKERDEAVGKQRDLQKDLDDEKLAASAARLIRYGITAGVAYSVMTPWPTTNRLDAPTSAVLGYVALLPAYWALPAREGAFCAAHWSATEASARAIERVEGAADDLESGSTAVGAIEDDITTSEEKLKKLANEAESTRTEVKNRFTELGCNGVGDVPTTMPTSDDWKSTCPALKEAEPLAQAAVAELEKRKALQDAYGACKSTGSQWSDITLTPESAVNLHTACAAATEPEKANQKKVEDAATEWVKAREETKKQAVATACSNTPSVLKELAGVDAPAKVDAAWVTEKCAVAYPADDAALEQAFTTLAKNAADKKATEGELETQKQTLELARGRDGLATRRALKTRLKVLNGEAKDLYRQMKIHHADIKELRDDLDDAKKDLRGAIRDIAKASRKLKELEADPKKKEANAAKIAKQEEAKRAAEAVKIEEEKRQRALTIQLGKSCELGKEKLKDERARLNDSFSARAKLCHGMNLPDSGERLARATDRLKLIDEEIDKLTANLKPTSAELCLTTKVGFYVGVGGAFDATVHLPDQPTTVVSNRDITPAFSFGAAIMPNAMFGLLLGATVGSVTRDDGTSDTIWMGTVGIGGAIDLLSFAR